MVFLLTPLIPLPSFWVGGRRLPNILLGIFLYGPKKSHDINTRVEEIRFLIWGVGDWGGGWAEEKISLYITHWALPQARKQTFCMLRSPLGVLYENLAAGQKIYTKSKISLACLPKNMRRQGRGSFRISCNLFARNLLFKLYHTPIGY